MLDNTTYEKNDDYADVRREAEASLAARRNKRAARGYAVLATMAGYGAFGEENSMMAKAAYGAKLFVIWFTFISPILMVLHLRG